MAARIDDLSKREQAALARWAKMRSMWANFIDAATRRHWRDCEERAQWLVLAIDGRKAESVRDSLEDADVETLMPMEKRIVIHSRTKERITRERPLLPGYLMVRCIIGPAALMGLNGVAGVRHVLLMADGDPYVVNNNVVMKFKKLNEISDEENEELCEVSKGDFVEVMCGPFEGIRAHVRSVDTRKRLAVIKATMFAGKLDIPIPLAFVEKL
ncbi:transcription termination/antitermination protein NusG [Martelella mangrovi]|uniref:Transcriptional antiterminator NusG n=1 Tax=Martelella mangrovi TaxID=1397477 RepID=A0ABV2IGX7_9HYPH